MFKKAERKKKKIKIGISGPSGSGKTMGALLLAKGLGGRIAVIDSENESASLYADHAALGGLEFDTLNLKPPYSVEKYVDAWKAAETAKYDVTITDSVSHAWAGDGGILNEKTKVDARGGNSFTNWAKFTPKQEQFLSAILSTDSHMIVTLRSKQDYVMSDNGQGKQVPKKVGLAPVQREGFEYELDIVFEVDINHVASVSKDRTGLFRDESFKLTEAVGKRIREWLESGAVEAPVVEAPKEEPKTILPKRKLDLDMPILDSEKNLLAHARTEAGWISDDVKHVLQEGYDVTDPKNMKPRDFRELCGMIKAGMTPNDIVSERRKSRGLPPALDTTETI